MKQLLTLHEAMVVVLIGSEERSMSTTQIADEINRRGLYKKKDGSLIEPSQIKMRATLSGGKYHHLFEFIEPDTIKLK